MFFGAKSSGSIFSYIYFFQLELFRLYQTTKVFSPPIKELFIISITSAPFNSDSWLIIEGEQLNYN